MPIIISVQKTTFGYQTKVSLFELLTVFEFIRAISTQTDFSELDVAYLGFGKALLSEVWENRLTEREILTEIDKLKEKMYELLPDFDNFLGSFTQLRFHKNNSQEISAHEQMLTKYAIYTLNNLLDVINHGAGEVYRTKDDDLYSIEHIRAKKHATEGKFSREYLIGNLMVLEQPINNDLEDMDVDEKISEYENSAYPQVKELIKEDIRLRTPHFRVINAMEWDINNFDTNSIENRGRYLARYFYDKILDFLE